jgi:hypothetical protein
MEKELIRELAVQAGFTLKGKNDQGEPDLHDYVYEFAGLLADQANAEIERLENLYGKARMKAARLEEELHTSRTYGEHVRAINAKQGKLIKQLEAKRNEGK